MPVLLLVSAAAIAAVTGCASSASHASGGATPSATALARTGLFSAAKLRSALLTRINGAAAVVPAASGSYASLPRVTAAAQSAREMSVMPKACGQLALDGLDSTLLAGAPAASVSFRMGHNGVSEMLVAPTSALAARAFGAGIPTACDHYRATIGGKTFRYTIRESTIKGVGEQARVLNVQTAGYPADNVWSIVYRASGFVGEVIETGPNASELTVRQLGQQAYARAAKALS